MYVWLWMNHFVIQTNEKLQRDLRLGGVGDEFNCHFVGWRRVCEPIQDGGLGIYDLVLFN